uniref:cell surface glycoprotein CD200 receptor 1 n=1 Tax=Jaculus jaculus TaxID=51337 RepID=UPI001E1B4A71|nr:cell surface glycoprotein CD200 receptor 1 [Jaculus jaculus]
MLCPWRTSDPALFLMWLLFSVLDYRSTCMNEKQTIQNTSLPLAEVNTTVMLQRGKEAVLCCPLVSLAEVVLVTWKILRRGKPSCVLSYRAETQETNETCTDRRITWVSAPGLRPHLHIGAVTPDLDGHYLCEIATPDGNFQRGHDLQVLVPPAVTLSLEKNATVVCEAATGKPAAQISWTPDGDCDTKNESDVNDTVTVRSTCHWAVHSVSVVTCLVSHLTGNKSLSTELNQADKNLESYVQYIIPPVVILIIMGSLWLLKIIGCRKCKSEKPEATPVVEEDEMQPYASYTEKCNPLYDTGNEVKMPQLSHSEVDRTGLKTSPPTRN